MTISFVDDGTNYCKSKFDDDLIEIADDGFYQRTVPFTLHTCFYCKQLEEIPKYQTYPHYLLQIIATFTTNSHLFKYASTVAIIHLEFNKILLL